MTRKQSKYPGFLFPILVTSIVVFVVAILLELVAYFLIVGKGYNFYLPLDLQRMPEIVANNEKPWGFSPALGWEPVYPNPIGYRGNEKPVDEAILAVFGDSFTQGHPWIDGSWPYLLEQRLGKPVLNFGVGAYGTDQAYLRFRLRHFNRLSTPYVALCIQSENIARIVNVYRGFYMRGTEASATKPRFRLTKEGFLKLTPNPIRNFDEYAQLSEMRFLEELGENDYWFDFFEKFDLNRHAKFPYALRIVEALPFYIGRLFNYRLGNNAHYKPLYKDPEATEILRLLIRQFVQDVEGSQAIPLIVFFPNSKDLIDYTNVGRTVYQDFYETVRSDYEFVFDGLTFFTPGLDSGMSVSEFFKPRKDGHYNLLSEELVSDGLHDHLCHADKKFGLLEDCRR